VPLKSWTIFSDKNNTANNGDNDAARERSAALRRRRKGRTGAIALHINDVNNIYFKI
jgi:hypothetical protein